MKSEDLATIFYVGGHGPIWNLVDNSDSIALIEAFYNSGSLWLRSIVRPVSSVH
jgi:hypothetical protein